MRNPQRFRKTRKNNTDGLKNKTIQTKAARIRTCAACRVKRDKGEFHRVVLLKDGTAFLDGTGKGQGRGAYVCKDDTCIEKLIKQRGLNRSFKREIDKAVYDSLKDK